jgi:hypothetical protein
MAAAVAAPSRAAAASSSGSLEVVLSVSGSERVASTGISRTVDSCERIVTDETERFSWVYTWRLPRRALLHGGAVEASSGGYAGRVVGSRVRDDCAGNVIRTYPCDFALPPGDASRGELVAGPRELVADPGALTVAPESGCDDVVRNGWAAGGSNGELFATAPIGLRALRRMRPGARRSFAVASRRPDIDCTEHAEGWELDPCVYHLQWAGTLTVRRSRRPR